MNERNLPRSLSRWWWGAVTVAALLTLTLGPWGFWFYLAARDEGPTVSGVIYRTLQAFVLSGDSLIGPVPWQLEMARFLAAFVGLSTAALALLQLFHYQLQFVRLRFYRGHIILCGLGPIGGALVEALRRGGERVVVLERDENHEGVALCREHGAVVLTRLEVDERLLRQAGLGRARLLLTLFAEDADNLRLALLAREQLSTQAGCALKCVIQVANRDLRNFLLREDLLGRAEDPFRLELLNCHEAMAQAMLALAASVRQGKGPLRLLLVGLGQLGEALLVRAARNWQLDDEKGPRRQVIVVDGEADRLATRIRTLYPVVESICDAEYRTLDVQSQQFAQGDFLPPAGPEGPRVDIAFVCLGNEALALLVAVRLSDLLGNQGVPIVLRLSSSTGLPTLLAGKQVKGVRALGLREVLASPALVQDATREVLARTIHEQYLRGEAALGLTSANKPSLVPWEMLPEHFKESNRGQAADIPAKLRAIDCRLMPAGDERPLFQFTDEQIERLARMEHDRWRNERCRAGWAHGKVRDDARKLHPSLVPWEQLTELDRDRNLRAIKQIPTLVARAGFVIASVTPAADGTSPPEKVVV
jgi:voltage-gated potassium channel Kch